MKDAQAALLRHQDVLTRCRRCPRMQSTPVVGNPVLSRVLLVGQAPGPREPDLGRPFAWTAGRMLFRWFGTIGVDEAAFRGGVYMAAVCRCFPGKRERGGDRVPDADEIANCAGWLDAEMALLRPRLVLAVGKLAIARFMAVERLDACVGTLHRMKHNGCAFDLAPLPHPSGASTWQHTEPGKTLLGQALGAIAAHPAWKALRSTSAPTLNTPGHAAPGSSRGELPLSAPVPAGRARRAARR